MGSLEENSGEVLLLQDPNAIKLAPDVSILEWMEGGCTGGEETPHAGYQ